MYRSCTVDVVGGRRSVAGIMVGKDGFAEKYIYARDRARGGDWYLSTGGFFFRICEDGGIFFSKKLIRGDRFCAMGG